MTDTATNHQTPMTEWVRSLYETDATADWYWTTLNPRTDVFRDDLSLNQADRLSPEDLIDRTSRTTARLLKSAIHRTLTEINPRFSRNNPERMGVSASLAVFLVPAVAHNVNRIHYHGWIRCARLSPADLDRVMVRQDRRDVTALCPRAVATLLTHLNSAFGSNLHLANEVRDGARHVVPETPETLTGHAGYLRPDRHDEVVFIDAPVAQPGWYWKAALASVA